MNKTVWDSGSIDKRRGWIWTAGFTLDAASRYSDRSWDNLPFYVQEMLLQNVKEGALSGPEEG